MVQSPRGSVNFSPLLGRRPHPTTELACTSGQGQPGKGVWLNTPSPPLLEKVTPHGAFTPAEVSMVFSKITSSILSKEVCIF